MPTLGATERSRVKRVRTLAVVAALVVWVVLADAQAPPPVAVRFHHAHYRVGDPAAAMSEAARRVEGIRVIVQGLGVGIRAGREFMLFDRLEDGDVSNPGLPVTASYPAAVARLTALGFTVEPAAVAQLKTAAVFTDLAAHHLAFAAEDFPAAVARLTEHELPISARRDDSVLFAAAPGLAIEIVRDTTRPDAYWCPMHPDVRAADPLSCSLCGMALVPIPPPMVGEYKLDLRLERKAGDRTVRAIELRVRDPGTNAPVSRFATVHEKPFHLFVISRDLQHFLHVHPEQKADGSFMLVQDLPPGEYMLFADFLPEGGTPQMVQRAIMSGSASERARRFSEGPSDPRATAAAATSAVVDGVRVTLDAEPPLVGKELPMTFTLSHASTGLPVTDLQPYLGAPAHLLIVRSDLEDAIHAHPEEQATGGPTVSFHPLIPSAGEYCLWIQFQRDGRVITARFRLPTAR